MAKKEDKVDGDSGSTDNRSSVEDQSNHTATPKNSCCAYKTCKRAMKIIAGVLNIIINVVFLLGAILGLVAAYYHVVSERFTKDQSTKNNFSINIGYLPREIGDSFDTSLIGKIELYTNYTNSTSVTSYYGECRHVSYKMTQLPVNTVKLTNITANSPVPVNYDSLHSPVFALTGSNFTYDVSFRHAIQNFTKVGCAFIYLFNTSESYQMFLNGKTGTTYLNKSECIIVKHEFPPIPISHIINITSETFIFGAVKANVSYSNAVITISGFRREYDVSRLKSLQINSNVTPIDLCNSSDCKYFGTGGKEYCVFVNSTNYTRINYTEDSVPFPLRKSTWLEIVIILMMVIALLAFVWIVTSIIIYICCGCQCCYCYHCCRSNDEAAYVEL